MERLKEWWEGYEVGKWEGRALLAEELAVGKEQEWEVAKRAAEQARRWAEHAKNGTQQELL